MSNNAVLQLSKLKDNDGVMLFKAGAKQLALFLDDDGEVHAIDNRCPHEGYPLSKGTVDGKCQLTCNWHNWKFDLKTGTCLVGADHVRHYETEIVDDEIRVDLSDPSPEDIKIKIFEAIHEGFARRQSGRIGREMARLSYHNLDPSEVIAEAITWSHDRFEFGTNHAIAAAPDWLALHDRLEGSLDLQLTTLVEIMDYLAFTSQYRPEFPYREEPIGWSEDAFLEAIETENQKEALGLIKGALAKGKTIQDLESVLVTAALTHYRSFGHTLIYVQKARQLIERLGPSIAEPVLLCLVREMCYSNREDLIPEFSHYAKALESMGSITDGKPDGNVQAMSANQAMDCVATWSVSNPEASFFKLLEAAADNLLHFDLRFDVMNDGKPNASMSWLGLTHALTFAAAVWDLCRHYPEHWPTGLLQLSAFVGRGNFAVNRDQDMSEWHCDNKDDYIDQAQEKILDHGIGSSIHVAHYIKNHEACLYLIDDVPEDVASKLMAATLRFLYSPARITNHLRTVRQGIALVARDFE